MYAALYVTPLGFSSVAYIGAFGVDRVRLADPIFGWQELPATDCFAVIHTETGYVLPGVVPALSDSLATPWLVPSSEKLAANKVIKGPWVAKYGARARRHPKTLLEPELGGDKFVSGYPHAWERIQRWAFEVAPDWRSLALSAIFARCSIQRPIEEAEMLYRQFGPTLRDALLRGDPPSPEQMMRWRGIKGTRAVKREGGLDDLRSFQDIMAWAPWCAELLASRDDMSRQVRDVIAVEWLPWGIGVAKLSFTMMLSGRDAACMDTRMLNYFFGDSTFDPAELEAGDDYASNARKWTEPETRMQFLSRVSSRSTAEGARGVTAGAIKTYSWLEGKLRDTPYFDAKWPQPYAKAQWMLWETLGRTAGTANHGALWEVIDPLIEEITGRVL